MYMARAWHCFCAVGCAAPLVADDSIALCCHGRHDSHVRAGGMCYITAAVQLLNKWRPPLARDGADVVSSLFQMKLKVTLKCMESDETTQDELDMYTIKCNITGEINHLHDGIRIGLVEDREKRSDLLQRTASWQGDARLSVLPAYLTIQVVRFFYKVQIQQKAKIRRKVCPCLLPTRDSLRLAATPAAGSSARLDQRGWACWSTLPPQDTFWGIQWASRPAGECGGRVSGLLGYVPCRLGCLGLVVSCQGTCHDVQSGTGCLIGARAGSCTELGPRQGRAAGGVPAAAGHV